MYAFRDTSVTTGTRALLPNHAMDVLRTLPDGMKKRVKQLWI